jgi:hypothetical protein
MTVNELISSLRRVNERGLGDLPVVIDGHVLRYDISRPRLFMHGVDGGQTLTVEITPSNVRADDIDWSSNVRTI